MSETNPLVAERVDNTSPLAGTFLIEDGEALLKAIESKDWLAGGLAMVSGTFDAAAMASDPIGTFIAMGLGWVIDHVEPFTSWLEELTGDADQVRAHAATWQNIQLQMEHTAETLRAYVDGDIAEMSGLTIDAYRRAAEDAAKAIEAVGAWAGGMGTALNITAFIVQFVHDFVRDAISQVLGSVMSYTVELIVSVGTAWPVVAEQIATRVASLTGQAGRYVEGLVTSARNLVGKLRNLQDLFAALGSKLDELFHGLGAAAAPLKNQISNLFPGGGPKKGTPKTPSQSKPPTLKELFQDHAKHKTTRDDALKRLDDLIPPGFERKDFNATNVENSLRELRERGYDPDSIEELERAARSATTARRNIRDTAAKIGETGGREHLDEHPFLKIIESFRSPDVTPPGGYSDCSAVAKDLSELAVVEFKGMSARPNSKPVRTRFEGMARQGEGAYARDHLLSDPRYAEYLRENPDLWQGIQDGTTRLNFKTISTRAPDGPSHVVDNYFPILTDKGGTEVMDTLQKMIDGLDP
ncbi:MAG: hypothetical protein Q4D79_07465 [Propionibacteriaceae bacterium]|nr:hypothetical protein [Propionibacteriaceae bacterium]